MYEKEIIAHLQVAALDYVSNTPKWADKFEAMRKAVKHVEKAEKAFSNARRVSMASLKALKTQEE